MILVISGHVGSDEGATLLNTVTGVVTKMPGNRYADAKHALHILKHGVEANDTELRKVAIKAASDFFDSKEITEIFGPNGNVVAIF